MDLRIKAAQRGQWVPEPESGGRSVSREPCGKVHSGGFRLYSPPKNRTPQPPQPDRRRDTGRLRSRNALPRALGRGGGDAHAGRGGRGQRAGAPDGLCRAGAGQQAVLGGASRPVWNFWRERSPRAFTGRSPSESPSRRGPEPPPADPGLPGLPRSPPTRNLGLRCCAAPRPTASGEASPCPLFRPLPRAPAQLLAP
jgi:hypothetical protein